MNIHDNKMLARYPALASLGLGPDELRALARQGKLLAESVNGKRRYFKLRFRIEGQQRVRYVGCRPGFVALVQQELERLQAPTHVSRALNRLVREARRRLRIAQRRLAPLLPGGWKFHGRELRPLSELRESVSEVCYEEEIALDLKEEL